MNPALREIDKEVNRRMAYFAIEFVPLTVTLLHALNFVLSTSKAPTDPRVDQAMSHAQALLREWSGVDIGKEKA